MKIRWIFFSAPNMGDSFVVKDLIKDAETYRYAQTIYIYIEAIDTKVDIGSVQIDKYIKWAK